MSKLHGSLTEQQMEKINGFLKKTDARLRPYKSDDEIKVIIRNMREEIFQSIETDAAFGFEVNVDKTIHDIDFRYRGKLMKQDKDKVIFEFDVYPVFAFIKKSLKRFFSILLRPFFRPKLAIRNNLSSRKVRFTANSEKIQKFLKPKYNFIAILFFLFLGTASFVFSETIQFYQEYELMDGLLVVDSDILYTTAMVIGVVSFVWAVLIFFNDLFSNSARSGKEEVIGYLMQKQGIVDQRYLYEVPKGYNKNKFDKELNFLLTRNLFSIEVVGE